MKNIVRNYLLAVLGLAVLVIISLAWTGKHQKGKFNTYQDTVPTPKKSTKTPTKEYNKDFDKEIDAIERAMKDTRDLPDIDFRKMQEEIDASMKKVNEEMAKHKIDMEKMQKELDASLSKIDMRKIDADIQRSLRDLDKLHMEDLKESLSNMDDDEFSANLKNSLRQIEKIDFEKMNQQIQESLKDLKVNIDAEAISRSVQESLAKVDLDKMKVDMEKLRSEMEKNKDNMKLDMRKMQKDLNEAKEQLQGYQEMVYEMEKDGLLNTKADYAITYKNGELFINGKKQPAAVASKFEKYFSKDGITIRKEKGEMNINIQ
jgi:hypothetical protein